LGEEGKVWVVVLAYYLDKLLECRIAKDLEFPTDVILSYWGHILIILQSLYSLLSKNLFHFLDLTILNALLYYFRDSASVL
jgi:hypothetical protein